MDRPAPSTAHLPPGTFYAKDENGRVFLTSVSALEHNANSGQTNSTQSAYLLGVGYESGIAAPNHQPDYSLAVRWYNVAVTGGSVRGIYREGVLYALEKSSYPDASGVYRRAPGLGKQLMNIALEHGYDPSTDIVHGPSVLTPAQIQKAFASIDMGASQLHPITPAASAPTHPSDPLTIGDLFAGLLVVGAAAALLSGGGNSTGSTNTSETIDPYTPPYDPQAHKTCWIDTSHSVPDSSPSGSHWETDGHNGYGYQCP